VKAELTLPSELVKEIAKEVMELLKPVLSGNSNHKDDIIFDVQRLAEYLAVSKQWIYERSHLKEIPHIKKQGLLRFRKRDIDKWLDSDKIPAIDTSKTILKSIGKGRALPYKGSVVCLNP